MRFKRKKATTGLVYPFYMLLGFSLSVCHPARAQQAALESPDKKTRVFIEEKSGSVFYNITYNGKRVIHPSRLGLNTSKGDLSSALKIVQISSPASVSASYELFTGKKRLINYKAIRSTIQVRAKDGQKYNIIFQVSNDGVAFRYHIPLTTTDTVTILSELTSFALDTVARGFLQPMQVAKTGFEQTNPAYEDNYIQNIPAGSSSPSGAGWVYPALFRQNDTWLLLTEAGLDGSYCATRLLNKKGVPEYTIGFPDSREVMTPDGLLPEATKTFYTPWRVIAIGSLATIIESTLGTDVAQATTMNDKSFIHPGKASWSWIMSKDDSIVYSEQKRYIDFAASMKWQYTLVDAAWDTKIGYEKIQELSTYAQSKGVGLLLWYNSAGNWNTVKYTPRDKLLTHESRTQEFNRLKAMGIKGVKIDFFGGDGRSVIQYYVDILKDAATAGLLVNFHGATLPRGWSRTYPHLVTTEAVKGFEMITFNQEDANREPNHAAMLPFTRNAFDPMDFTPMNLYKIPTKVQRKTTSAFELATSVLFLSGIQHFAESPAGMSHMPEEVISFLQQLPVQWDDVKFIDGFPGKHIVLARKRGTRWYIAGINGEATSKTITLPLGQFKCKTARLLADGDKPGSFTSQTTSPSSLTSITMQPNGGFVIVLE